MAIRFPLSKAYPEVNTYADLPLASTHSGLIYVVLNASGSWLWPFTYHSSGFYRSNGTTWLKIDGIDEIKDGVTLTDISGVIVGSGGTTTGLGYTPENILNKDTSITLGTSNIKYPSQNAVKTYVDTAISVIPIVTPAGSDTELQFNSGGSFGADAQLTFDYTNKFFKTYFTDGPTFNIETTNNALGFGVKASILTETDGNNTSLIGTFDNTPFGGAVVNSGIVNMNLSTMGITSFIVNDGSIGCSTPSGNFTVVNDTDGIVFSSDETLPNPIQFYLSGNMVAKFEPTGKLSLLNRGIYDDATINFSSDGSDPSVFVEGDLWRNGDRLFFVKSTGAFDIANQLTSPGGANTNLQFNNAGLFGGSNNLVYDYINNVMGIGTSSPLVNALIDVGGSTQLNTKIHPRAAITSNANRIECLQLQNKSSGTAAEIRFMAACNSGSFIAFTQPSSTNISTYFFGVQRKTGSFIVNSCNNTTDARNMYIGTLDNKNLYLCSANKVRMTFLNTGYIGVNNTLPAHLFSILQDSPSVQNTLIKLQVSTMKDNITCDIDFGISTSSSVTSGRFGTTRTSRATAADTDFAWSLYSGGRLTERMRLRDDGLLTLPTDNTGIILGAGSDASIYYDGTNMIINPKVVGSGIVDVSGTLQTDGYNSSDGSTGITTTKSWVDNGGNTHDVTVKDGLITAWTVT